MTNDYLLLEDWDVLGIRCYVLGRRRNIWGNGDWRPERQELRDERESVYCQMTIYS